MVPSYCIGVAREQTNSFVRLAVRKQATRVPCHHLRAKRQARQNCIALEALALARMERTLVRGYGHAS
jgi:hypothetical protein